MKLLFYTIIFLTNFLGVLTLRAQEQPKIIDPAGYITKYDSLFNGIGPRVYFLPAPRSKAAILQDQIDELSPFTDTLTHAMLFQDLIQDFENTANYEEVRNILESNQVNLNNLSAYISTQKETNDEASALFNEIAKIYMLQHEFSKAEFILIEGIKIAESKEKINDKLTLQNNLIAIYLYNKDYAKAKYLTEELIKENKKNKSGTENGKTLVTLAKVQALTDDLKTAELTILRKALPIFDKNKDYENKIKSWIALAQLYILNKKYPEAQWFLIQAQELAEKRNIPQYNSTIEYLLGSSKFYQSNFIFSKKELQKAFQLAKQADDKYLQLMTSQMLAAVNVKLNETTEAEEFLKTYWSLRNQLF